MRRLAHALCALALLFASSSPALAQAGGFGVAGGGSGLLSTTAPTSGQIPIGNAGGTAYVPQTLTGDLTVTNLGVTTLKNTGPGVTSATLASVTIDAQGRVTALSSGTVTQTLQAAYNGGATITTSAAKAIAFTDFDGTDLLQLNKNFAGGGNGLLVTKGASASGTGIAITDNGSGYALKITSGATSVALFQNTAANKTNYSIALSATVSATGYNRDASNGVIGDSTQAGFNIVQGGVSQQFEVQAYNGAGTLIGRPLTFLKSATVDLTSTLTGFGSTGTVVLSTANGNLTVNADASATLTPQNAAGVNGLTINNGANSTGSSLILTHSGTGAAITAFALTSVGTGASVGQSITMTPGSSSAVKGMTISMGASSTGAGAQITMLPGAGGGRALDIVTTNAAYDNNLAVITFNPASGGVVAGAALYAQRVGTWSGGGTEPTNGLITSSYAPTVSASGTYTAGASAGTIWNLVAAPSVTGGTLTASGTLARIGWAPLLSGGVAITDTTTGLGIAMTPQASSAVTGLSITMGANAIGASAALKITNSGTLPAFLLPKQSTPDTLQQGAIWHDSGQQAFSFTTGNTSANGLTQNFVGCMATQGATQNRIANSAAEASLITAAAAGSNVTGTIVGTQTFPISFWKVGKCVRVTLTGYYQTQATPGTALVRVMLGGVSVATSGAQTLNVNAQVNVAWTATIIVTCAVNNGATSTFWGGGTLLIDTTLAGLAPEALGLAQTGQAAATVDQTATTKLDVLWTWGTASATNIINTTSVCIEILNDIFPNQFWHHFDDADTRFGVVEQYAVAA